jgi:hypothetical protein
MNAHHIDLRCAADIALLPFLFSAAGVAVAAAAVIFLSRSHGSHGFSAPPRVSVAVLVDR